MNRNTYTNYTSTKSCGGNVLTSICVCVCVYVCVCVCVCVWLSVCLYICEQNADRTDAPIWTQFSLNGRSYSTGSNPFEIGNLGSKVKVTVIENVSKNDEKIR